MLNRTGRAENVIVSLFSILLIVGLLIFAGNMFGILTLQKIKHNYLVEITATPNETTKFGSTQISFNLLNPTDGILDSRINIDFNQTAWRTDNIYVKSGEPIPLEGLAPNEIKKYTISFNANMGGINENSTYIFYIKALDSANNTLDFREVEVYVRRQ